MRENAYGGVLPEKNRSVSSAAPLMRMVGHDGDGPWQHLRRFIGWRGTIADDFDS